MSAAALHEVLLQAALRAERANEIRQADRRATELARRMDNRGKYARIHTQPHVGSDTDAA